MKKVFLLLAVLMLSGCATAGNKPTEAEKDAAILKINQCLEKNIPSLDDGQSDAATIAESLTGVCSVEYRALTDLMTRDKNIRTQRMIEDRSGELYQRSATTFVLRYRSANTK